MQTPASHPNPAIKPGKRAALDSRRWLGWLPLLVMPGVAAVLTPPAWPRWGVMWVLCIAIYCGCKWLTWMRCPIRDAPPWRHAAYLAAWPGMDASSFLNPQAAPTHPRTSEWLFAWCEVVLGLWMLFALAPRVRLEDAYWVGWVGMVGMASVLHFGIFRLLSCAWRRLGIDARPLMSRPLASQSLSEFWGRRWNTAFRDLAHRFLFRPLLPRLGLRGALVAGFAVSGLVHEAVISFPAGGGYGGPTMFFLVQGAGLMIERSRTGRRFSLGTGFCGWLFTMGMLIMPAPLLFHRPFVSQVILPFMQALGAL